MKKITIIGGGASGSLLAVNLIKHSGNQPLEINLIEKRELLGRGVAYSTAKDFHLLNVPAAKMGAFPSDIEHFFKWLQEKDYQFAPTDFVPRKIYGEYLQAVFQETVESKSSKVSVKIVQDEAVDVLNGETGASVLLESGEKLPSDKIVLAFGNFLPPNLRTENDDYTASEKYFSNPWSREIPDKINKNEDVLIIGTGLTMVDVVLSLYSNGHKGKIVAISARGLLPAVHAPAQPVSAFHSEFAEPLKLSQMFKIVRQKIKIAAAEGNNWRAVIDSLRPATQEIWFNLSLAEKRRFMRHLRRIWDVSRHRMPPSCAQLLQDLQNSGQLDVRAGRIKNIAAENGKFVINYLSKNEKKSVSVDAVINCTGSECNFEKLQVPLLKNLIGKGEIKPDALFLGLEATPDGKIIKRNGEVSEKVCALGTALRGVLWESTAMPEIRVQANKLALSLLA